MNIVSNKDIARMLSSADISDENYNINLAPFQRKDELKRRSKNHVSKWTNTLESQREVKLRWKKEVQEEAEEQRRKIDAEEYKLKVKTRNEVIQRAKDLQYEQKEKVIFLRSQQLYTDVIATREQQIIEKVQSEAKLVDKEKQWHQQNMQITNDAEKREKTDVLIKKEREKIIGRATLKHILEKEVSMKRKSEQQKKDEGAVIRRIAIDDKKEEDRQFQEKLAAKKKIKDEMDKLPDDMKNAREARLLKEKEEAAERKEKIAAMSLLANERAQLEKIHFEQRLAGRKILSNEAEKLFNAKATKEMESFVKEQKKQESTARERQEMEARKAKESKMRIHQSRQDQIKLKEAEKLEEIKEHSIFTEACKALDLQEQQTKREEELNRRQKDTEIRKFQEKQTSERQKQRARERVVKLEGERKNAKELKREDDVFQEFALREIEKFRIQGKKTNLLEKSMGAENSLLF